MDTINAEVKAIFKVTWPMIFLHLLQWMTISTSVVFCGHLGKATLDAVSLATLFINIFGMANLIGLATACDTLFAQSYGSKQFANMGIVLQRGLVVLLLACLPLTAVFINAEHFLEFTGQDKEISRLTGQFIRVSIAGMPAMAIWQVLRSFTYSQGIVHTQYIIMGLANIFNVGFHLLLVTHFQFGITGAAVCFSLTQWSLVGLYLSYVLVWKAHEGMWNGWTIVCLDNLGEFLRLGIPGLLMFVVEWGTGDIITFIVGLLGQVELAAFTVTYNLNIIMLSVSTALSYGGAVRVGTNLGANLPEQAKCTMLTTCIMALPVAGLIAIVLVLFRNQVPYIYTQEREVVEFSSQLTLWMALQTFFAAIETAQKGLIRGVGDQAYGALVMVIYAIVCLPLSVLLLLKTNVGVKGCYIGMTVGAVIQTGLFTVRLFRLDWNKEAILAQKRSGIVETKSTSSPYQSSFDTNEKLVKGLKDPQSEFTTSNADGYGSMKTTIADGERFEADSNQDKSTDNVKGTGLVGNASLTKEYKAALTCKISTIVSVLLIILVVSICLSVYLTNLRNADINSVKHT